MRFSANARREQIRQAGLTIAIKDGLAAVTPERVASESTVPMSAATVRRYFPTHDDLRRSVAEHSDASSLIRQESKVLGLTVTIR